MSESERRYSLTFSSSSGQPLAWCTGEKISSGRFRSDVERLIQQLPIDGKILVTCAGRYGFSVALLASWLAQKSVILPPNHIENTLTKIREKFCVAFECDDAWEQIQNCAYEASSHDAWNIELQGSVEAVHLYTSGSSGEPKVIVKTIANLFDEVCAIKSQFDWPDGAIIATVPPQHLYGLTFSVLLPWVLGNAWIDEVLLYPQDITAAIENTGGKTLISVPAQYQALLQDNAVLDGIQCVSAAAPMPADFADEWQQRYQEEILEVYGSTETGVVAYRRQTTEDAWSVFKHVTLSENNGLLKVNSPFVSDQYEGGFLTADQVELLADGTFNLEGRVDSIVKIAGKRISLSYIESSLLACDGVVEAAVIAVQSKGLLRDKAIWAAVVANDGHLLSPRKLQSDLRGFLDGVEVPRKIVVVDQLPRTASGKLPRQALEQLFTENIRADVSI